MSERRYEFNDLGGFVHKAATYTAYRYRHYGVETDDVTQEIAVWMYGDGRPKIDRWLESSPQQTTRIYRTMLDKALGYAEGEKAERVGYRVDDVAWYTANTIEGLMPLVLDETFTQENGHIGELITMVVDIRRVLTTSMRDYFELNDNTDEAWTEVVRLVVDKLGGDRPSVGRRRVMSNAQSQAITGEYA